MHANIVSKTTKREWFGGFFQTEIKLLMTWVKPSRTNVMAGFGIDSFFTSIPKICCLCRMIEVNAV